MSQIPPNQSNYYRSGYSGSGGPGSLGPRNGVVSFDAIGTAWRLWTSDLGTWIPISLVAVLLNYLISIPSSIITNLLLYGSASPVVLNQTTINPAKIWMTFPIVFGMNLLMLGFYFMLQAGIMEVALRRMEGHSAGIGDMFVGFSRFSDMFLGGVAVGIITAIGSMFCLLPGLLLWSMLSFTPIIIYRQGLNGFDAIKQSYELLKSQMWMMFAVLFVAGLLTFSGLCACFVGIFFTYPILFITIAVIYYNFGIEAPAQQQPQWSNVPFYVPQAEQGSTEQRPPPKFE